MQFKGNWTSRTRRQQSAIISKVPGIFFSLFVFGLSLGYSIFFFSYSVLAYGEGLFKLITGGIVIDLSQGTSLSGAVARRCTYLFVSIAAFTVVLFVVLLAVLFAVLFKRTGKRTANFENTTFTGI